MDVMDVINLCDRDLFWDKIAYNLVTNIFVGCEMTNSKGTQQQKNYASAQRPQVTSYDSGYEHSIEHLAEVKFLMEEADEESGPAGQKRAMAAKA
jgi:hypothetical protein